MSTTFENSTELKPRIAVTLGDPAGIGPELAVKILANPESAASADITVLADRAELDAAARMAGVELKIADIPSDTHITVLDDASAPTEPIQIQEVSKQAGERVLHQLRRAMALANAGEIDAVLFAPLNKTSLKLGGMNEEDELRWFAKELGHEGATSELNILPGLVTARVTSHIPLAEVAARINPNSVLAAIQLLNNFLSASGIAVPRLAVCALNPHAGENGNFGREEIDQIGPGIQLAVDEGIAVQGPFPSDTVFLAAKRGDFDGVVTMYHDQGQIAMKLIGFDAGVTVQGGLPIAIATPAHGTAFDIVGKGIADTGAIEHALAVAIAIGKQRRNSQLR